MEIKKVIGIDTGVNTGFAVWDVDSRSFDRIDTLTIGMAFLEVYNMHFDGIGIHLRIEDARKRKWFDQKETISAKAQGAGSVKRDASVWESFCEALGISYELVAPKNNTTKVKDKLFKQMTGWKGSTNEHGRDAAMMVFRYDPIMFKLLRRAIK